MTRIEPLVRISGKVPLLSVGVTELIALMIGKKRFDALFTQIGGSVIASSRTNGRIGQFEATPAIGISIVPVPTL
jgi:hypothetical protein